MLVRADDVCARAVCHRHRDDKESISKEVDGKTPAEVKEYLKVFLARYKELSGMSSWVLMRRGGRQGVGAGRGAV